MFMYTGTYVCACTCVYVTQLHCTPTSWFMTSASRVVELSIVLRLLLRWRNRGQLRFLPLPSGDAVTLLAYRRAWSWLDLVSRQSKIPCESKSSSVQSHMWIYCSEFPVSPGFMMITSSAILTYQSIWPLLAFLMHGSGRCLSGRTLTLLHRIHFVLPRFLEVEPGAERLLHQCGYRQEQCLQQGAGPFKGLCRHTHITYRRM